MRNELRSFQGLCDKLQSLHGRWDIWGGAEQALFASDAAMVMQQPLGTPMGDADPLSLAQ